jgi:hypothetical protein
MLLDELEKAEAQCETMQAYMTRFHEADKRAAVLEERQRPANAVEVAFGVGVGLGGAIMGLAPTFWENQPEGWLALAVGFLLIVGATVVRIVKR